MKKLLLLLSILIMIFSLNGCAKSCSFQIGAVENSSSHKMSGSYYKLNGTKTKEITVKDGETLDISVDIKTKSGSIDVFIYNENKEYSYEGNDVPTSTFTVSLTEPGKYTIEVKAKNHKGGYSFEW
jgi:hypothetical protein